MDVCGVFILFFPCGFFSCKGAFASICVMDCEAVIGQDGFVGSTFQLIPHAASNQLSSELFEFYFGQREEQGDTC